MRSTLTRRLSTKKPKATINRKITTCLARRKAIKKKTMSGDLHQHQHNDKEEDDQHQLGGDEHDVEGDEHEDEDLSDKEEGD